MLEGFESRSDLGERRQLEYDMNIETRIIVSKSSKVRSIQIKALIFEFQHQRSNLCTTGSTVFYQFIADSKITALILIYCTLISQFITPSERDYNAKSAHKLH